MWVFTLALVIISLSSPSVAREADSVRARTLTDSLRSYLKQQVVVTGTRNEVRLKDSPVRVEVIGKDRIAATGMTDLGDLLKEQPGLLISGTVRSMSLIHI